MKLPSILLSTALVLSQPAVAADPAAIPESHYVTVRDGHLSLEGKRERYWAAIGKVFLTPDLKLGDSPEQREQKIRNARKGTDVIVQRLLDLGFNATRLWAVVPNTEDYTPGDGSRADAVDYFVAKAKEHGLKIWCAGLNRVGSADPGDVAIVDDAATADEWSAAVAGWDKKNAALSKNLARIWDPRLEALALREMRAVATHTNKHTGLRWCDDPVFAVWELSNEEWWMRKMLGGQWQTLPPFFKRQLLQKWNAWLVGKYGEDSKLQSAWKSLLPGESLAKGNILFAPMAGATASATSLNDASEAARSSLEGLKQKYSREDFAAQRGSDVIEFLLSIQIAHKQREATAVKSWGRSTQLCPLVYDTGIGYEIQSQYLHQHADATAHDAYVNGKYSPKPEPDPAGSTDLQKLQRQLETERKSPNAAPWVNWLLKPPGISQGVPWLEHNRVEGKPFFCYETQIQQPAKYRADFPLRLAALASIQDWDFVCWHYFAPPEDAGTAERPFDRAMDISTNSHPQGYHFTYDEVQSAMMRAAGHLWRQEAFVPAVTPTKFIYGRKSLHDPASMDYGGSYGAAGLDMNYTTYQHGVRIAIDPTREEDQVIGPVVKFADRATHNPYTPTPEIVFDWKKGFLSMDAPEGVAWTGMLGNQGGAVKFVNGVTLRDVKIQNPPGIFDPVGEEKYIAFALYATDGQPLASCKTVSLSLVSTSFNTGFQLPETPEEKTIAGKFPILAARVGGVVEARALDGMRYTLRDWHMQPIGEGRVTSGRLVIPSDKPVFVIELTR